MKNKIKKSLIILAIPLAVMAISAFSAEPAQAQTVMANGAVCPAGYTCTPIVQTTTVACPAGYTCTLTASANTSTYIPPQYTLPTNTLSTNLNYTLVNTNTNTNIASKASYTGTANTLGTNTNTSTNTSTSNST